MPRTLVLAVALALPALALPALPLHAQDAAERAQRAADNPLRMIIEAAKIKPRNRSAEAGRAVGKAAAAAPAASGAAAKAALRVAAEPAPPAAPEAPAAEAESVPLAVVEPAVREHPESTVVTIDVAAAAPLPPPAEPEATAAAAPEALRLLTVVEPVTPPALIGQLRGEVRAQVAFTVAPDGAVRGVRVQSITNPLMSSSVLQAVRQWRYQPIAEPREHEVEIVLRQD